MQTCPNCGSIVMRGDPYCTHCGATLRWYFNEEEEDYEPPEEDKKSKLHEIFNIMMETDMTTDKRFDLFSKYIFMTDYLLDEIRQSIHDEEKMYKCKFIMIHTATYLQVYIFFREDKYRDVLIFNRCYIEYSPGQFDPEEREFHYIYTKLYNEEKFQRKVDEMEKEGFYLKDIYSNITYPRFENDLTASFSDGENDMLFDIDDELNFRRIS